MAGKGHHLNVQEEDTKTIWRSGTRTPRPYHHKGEAIHQDAADPALLSAALPSTQQKHLPEPQSEHKYRHSSSSLAAAAHYNNTKQQHQSTSTLALSDSYSDDYKGASVPVTPAASESGTEADDERPHSSSFIKALPPAVLRPRKGLKVGEASEDVLLTPSQLDDEGRSYFRRKADLETSATGGAEEAGDTSRQTVLDDEEAEKVLRRRLAEFARRSSEVALVAAIAVVVLCGRGVWNTAAVWWRELLSHFIVIVLLVLVYPLKLSIVDTQATRRKLLERFRVPASFDPATVLYPPFLPILVALSVSSANEAVVLPNIILGLASLPQRLFPRSSRLGGFNSVHWLVSILPLIVAERTAWTSSAQVPTSPYFLRCSPPYGLSPETLVSLYPLHHALLQPLHYLTTTSLLISELHLLSAALINLLLLTSSPQATILKACLWVGGVTFFIFASPVLHWNVTLARVPRWKLRRKSRAGTERKLLVDAVTELISLQRATSAFSGNSADAVESDADEDEPKASIKPRVNGRPRLNTTTLATNPSKVPASAVEPRDGLANGFASPVAPPAARRPRSNTLPIIPDTAPLKATASLRRTRSRPSGLLWCFHLTADQANRRKWLYAGYVYIAIVIIILGPVRWYIETKALHDREPLGWALSYLFGQISFFRSLVAMFGLSTWVPLPHPSKMADWTWPWPWSFSFSTISTSLLETLQSTNLPLNLPLLRLTTLGPANTRLLLLAYWAAVLLLGLLAVFSLTAYVEVDTRRKIFHGVMVAMLLPATFVDPCYCSLALGLALAVFLLLEAIRAAQIPPLGKAIARFVAPYVDGRDLRGPVVVSHIFLLVGCAVPLWFSLASLPRGEPAASPLPSWFSSALLEVESRDNLWADWELEAGKREVAMVAGVVCVGLGDAAASLIGRRYGRHKWIWIGGKSLEGSAAFAGAVTAGLMAAKVWMVIGGWEDWNAGVTGFASAPSSGTAGAGRNAIALGMHGGVDFTLFWTICLVKAIVCAVGASFMEAVLTGANDNVVVPVALWLLVKGIRL